MPLALPSSLPQAHAGAGPRAVRLRLHTQARVERWQAGLRNEDEVDKAHTRASGNLAQSR